MCGSQQIMENSERNGNVTWTAFWEICMQFKKQQLDLDMEKLSGSKLAKEYVKAAYCHPAYITYMQSTSWETLGWRKHKAGIKIARRNINNFRYADDRKWLKVAESEEELKILLTKVKEKSEKVGLKLNIQKIRLASSPITSWQIDGKTMGTVADYFIGLQNHRRWWLHAWH